MRKYLWTGYLLVGLLVCTGCSLEGQQYQDSGAAPDAGGDMTQDTRGGRGGGEPLDLGLPPGAQAQVATCEYDDQVQFYTLDTDEHEVGEGRWGLQGLEPLNTDGPVSCYTGLPESTAGREAVVQFTAPDEGLYRFTSWSASTMSVASMCNLSRQFVGCAPVPYPLDPDFANTARALEVNLRADETVYLTLETDHSQPVDLTVQLPPFAGPACDGDAQCPGDLLCLEGTCSQGQPPSLVELAAWAQEDRLTFAGRIFEPDDDASGLLIELEGLDDQGALLWSDTWGQPYLEVERERGYLLQGQLGNRDLSQVDTIRARVRDNAGNWSDALTTSLDPLTTVGLGERCDPDLIWSRCQGALVCLPGTDYVPTCKQWELELFRRDDGYSYRAWVPDAAPSHAQHVSFHLDSPQRVWFNSRHPLVAITQAPRGVTPVSFQTDADYWERAGILYDDTDGVVAADPAPSEVSAVLFADNRAPLYDELRTFPIQDIPRPALGEPCDEDGVVNQCAQGGYCAQTGQSWRCQAANPTTVDQVRWFGDPNSGTFGLEISGQAAGADLTQLELVRVDAQGETFLNAEGATRLFLGDVDQFGYTALQTRGERFTATFSIVAWPFTFLPQSVAWRVTLVDAQGERTHADISPDAGQAPYTAGLQEPCDPLQQVSTCGQGLACERSPDPRGGFACIQDVERCQRDTQSTLALSMEGADLIQVNGYAVEDMGPVHCWGASQGADLIYRLDVTQAGRYHIWAQGAQGESLDLSVQRGCSLAYSGQLACAVSRQTPGNTPLSAALDLEQGETIYIHVQIAGALAGGFELSVARQ